MKKTFYTTTPIYYTNGIPHIGHSYSSIIADTISRYKKISNFDVKFSTGVDENSQKAVIKAEEEGLDVMTYLDKMAGLHKGVWDGLDIEYTDFIRTTEPRHHEFVREVLQKCKDNGDIYEGEYEGMYCVGCEAFKKDDDLIEKDGKKVCPDHLTVPDSIKEKNYFFKLSKYEDFLLNFYNTNPEFVAPAGRFNEVKEFVKRGLEDFSISRETNKFGIKLPFDENQVTYVWFDALFNYLTVCQNDKDENGKERFWPADLHVVGKDIIRFHAIYWPAMLKSAGYEMPKQILTTGFFTIDGHKISKSLGNVIDPVEFSEEYSKDLLTLYLLSSFTIGNDGDFDKKLAIQAYNAKLANNLGNLLNRAVVLTLKLGVEELMFEDFYDRTGSSSANFVSGDVHAHIDRINDEFVESMNKYNLKGSLDSVFSFLDAVNRYVDVKAPWTLIKSEETREEAIEVLYTICESLRVAGVHLYPFFPVKMTEMFGKLGLEEYKERLENGEKEAILAERPSFKIKEKGEVLFARFDVE